MTDKEMLKSIINGAAELEDGTIGLNNCIVQFCKENGFPKDIADKACNLAFTESALQAGIPLSVIQNEKNLKDYFSQDYIDFQCGVVK